MIRAMTAISVIVMTAGVASAAPLVRSAAGPDAASIQAMVDQFRADLGPNNGLGPSMNTTGRREINWDAVPDAFASPNPFPGNFFNQPTGSPAGRIRGAQFSTPGTGFLVSRNAAAGDVRFDDVTPGHSLIFQAFSAERIFASIGSTITDVTFSLPGSPAVPATVSGFGAVFMDVDLDSSTTLECFDEMGILLHSQSVTNFTNGFSFAGVSFDNGERVARVRITAGNVAIEPGVTDGLNGRFFQDLVAMDDFIYGEPVPAPAGAMLALGAAGALMRRRRRA